MSPPSPGATLRTLATLHGIQASYTNNARRRVQARRAPLLAALRSLGAPVESMADVPDAYRVRLRDIWARLVPPVCVAWEGEPIEVELRFPSRQADDRITLSATLEGANASHEWPVARIESSSIQERARVDGVDRRRALLRLPHQLPPGYHTLHVGLGRREGSSLLICTPRRTTQPADRSWGVFLPLYALRTGRDWGVGDLTDLEALAEWTASLGGDMVATLPLLAAFLDRPFEPSPYSPASRLFWNELYLDPTRSPELERSPRARSLATSTKFRAELEALRTAPLVDYRRTAAAKRRLFDLMAEDLEPGRQNALERFAAANPRLDDYARFRAAAERHDGPWTTWPARERDGKLARDGGNPHAHRHHRYVQWLAAEQMKVAADNATRHGAGLYFDLPVGVHPDGYDVWRERDAFVLRASAGAPPDRFFSGGQNWGFPPMHPDGIREQGYRYFRDCLGHLFRHASVVRIDHVMGLHRIYMVPYGLTAGDGVYIRYRAEELHAIVALESQRNRTVVVGEDLGTVPPQVRAAMRRRGILRSYVLQFQLRPNARRAIRRPAADAMATLDTHDLPMFAAFWRSLDTRMRLDAGWIDRRYAARLLRERERIRNAVIEYLRRKGWVEASRGKPSESAILRGALLDLAASDASMIVANLEDLWLETRPQNVPGTTDLYPNWRRRARYGLEEFRGRRGVVSTLEHVNRLRKGPPP